LNARTTTLWQRGCTIYKPALSHAPNMAETVPNPLAPAPPDTRLRGRRLTTARVVAVAMVLLTAWLFIASLPADYASLSIVCDSAPCDATHLTPRDAQALRGLGLAPESYAVYLLLLFVVVAVVFGGSAAVLVTRRSNDWLVLFVALMLLTFGTFTLTSAAEGLALAHPIWRIPTLLMSLFGDLSIIAFFYIFPTGRLVPRCAWVILLLWTVMQTLRYFFPGSRFNLANTAPPVYTLLFVAGIVSGMAAQVYRYFRASGPAQQQQTKWVVVGATLSVGGFVASNLLALLVPPAQRSVLLGAMLYTFQMAFILLLPLSIVLAALRYRLWDVDPLLNRVLVYGLLTALVVALYAGIVGGLGALFQAQGNIAISVLATGVAAVLFEPLRLGCRGA
jgi:hypothetical protein